MTEERATYNAGKPKGKKVVVTLTLDVADDQVADFLIAQFATNKIDPANAEVMTGPGVETPGAALALDFALADFLVNAVAPLATHIEAEVDPNAYYRRDWLKGFGLSATTEVTP